MDKEKLRQIFENNTIGKHRFDSVTYTAGDIDNIVTSILELEGERNKDREIAFSKIYKELQKRDKEIAELKEDAAHKEMEWFAEKRRADKYREALEKIKQVMQALADNGTGKEEE